MHTYTVGHMAVQNQYDSKNNSQTIYCSRISKGVYFNIHSLHPKELYTLP